MSKDARSWSRGIIGIVSISGGAGTRPVAVRGCCLSRLASVPVIYISRRACLHAAGWIARAEYAKVGASFDRGASNAARQCGVESNRPERVKSMRNPRDALSTRSPTAFAIDQFRRAGGSTAVSSAMADRRADRRKPSLTHCKTPAGKTSAAAEKACSSQKAAGRLSAARPRPASAVTPQVRLRAAQWSRVMPAADAAETAGFPGISGNVLWQQTPNYQIFDKSPKFRESE